MRKLLIQFVISRSLDSGAPLSKLWRRWISRSPELAQFERAARALDHRLKQREEAAESALPSSLHSSIMRAVRETEPIACTSDSDPVLGLSPALRWGLAAAGLLLLGTGLWLGLNHWPQPGGWRGHGHDLTALPAVGPLAERLTTNGIAALTLPLSLQMEDFSRDLRETAQFFLASLP